MNYSDIQKSKFYKDTYTKIEELKKDFYVDHGFLHISHVLKNAKSIASQFNLTKKEKQLLYIASVLHDVGYLDGRDDHALNGSIIARNFLEQNKVKLADIDIICNAIANHGGKRSEDFLEPVSKCLCIADKLDFVKSRYDKSLAPREIKNLFLCVQDTKFLIEDNKYIIEIYADENFDESAFLDDYFGKKLVAFLKLLSETFYKDYDLRIIKK